jgi:hypothetical protein
MGCCRENRLQFRLGYLGYVAVFGAGLLLTPDVLSGEASRMLVTFLGLLSASLLPTITLLVNGMTASGRSVNSILELDQEIRAALDALLFLFGCTGVAFAALMLLSLPPPEILVKVPYLTSDVLPRSGQSIVVLFVTAIIVRAGQIPGILRKALETRKQIAVQEARRKLTENAPDAVSIGSAFPTHPDFGKSVRIDELQS